MDSLPQYPTIKYLGSGYNLFKGSPEHTELTDPGFTNENIFRFTYNQDRTTSDDRYTIPDHTTINDAESCSFFFSSSIAIDTRSYLNFLKQHVDANFKVWGASFSGSTDFQRVSKKLTSDHTTVFVSSYAQCEVYRASVDNADLSEVFVDAVSSLPNVLDTSTRDVYNNFIIQFGTHAITGIKMGGRYGICSEFTIKNYINVSSAIVNVKAVAGYSGALDISPSLVNEEEKKAATIFNIFRQNYSTFHVGEKPSVSKYGNVSNWMNLTKLNPLPLSYSLTELYKYFTPKYFPSDTHIDTKRENLRNMSLYYYCMQESFDPDLCQKEFGPRKKDLIRVVTTNYYREAVKLTSNLSFWHYFKGDPNLRLMGTILGTSNLSELQKHLITMVDSRQASSHLITSSTKFTANTDNSVVRYKCPSGYSTVSDHCLTIGHYGPPSLVCIADHCLTTCRKMEINSVSSRNIYLIGDGYPELGNSGKLEKGSFFRDLSINDDTSTEDLFKCLKYNCLSVDSCNV